MRSLKKQKLSLDSLIINGKSSEVTVFNMTIKLFNGACTNCAPMQLRTKGAYPPERSPKKDNPNPLNFYF